MMFKAFLLLVAALLALPVAALPVFQFDESSVIATGLTPGGAVVVFGVAKQLQGFPKILSRMIRGAGVIGVVTDLSFGEQANADDQSGMTMRGDLLAEISHARFGTSDLNSLSSRQSSELWTIYFEAVTAANQEDDEGESNDDRDPCDSFFLLRNPVYVPGAIR